ncbi:MAG: aspartate/glutamate racemase family protein [Variovorax sp.]|nr:MAG: aspartate/glutamate racemase family protein [Variovorax sp.]
MGPAAGADFVRLFVDACAQHMRTMGEPVRDQAFPEHWLAQVPVPDRSGALERADEGAHQPLVEVLHVAREVAAHLAAQGETQVALMATEGTYRVRLYEQALADAGLQCHLPWPDERALVMRGIYEGVKAGDLPLAQACFSEVALRLAERHGRIAIVMGCTEVPLGLQGVEAVQGLRLVDPARVLASALADRAYAGTSPFGSSAFT